MTRYSRTRQHLQSLIDRLGPDIRAFGEEAPLTRQELIQFILAESQGGAKTEVLQLESQPDSAVHHPGYGNAVVLTWSNGPRETLHQHSNHAQHDQSGETREAAKL